MNKMVTLEFPSFFFLYSLSRSNLSTTWIGIKTGCFYQARGPREGKRNQGQGKYLFSFFFENEEK
jgi:hypothetical protein